MLKKCHHDALSESFSFQIRFLEPERSARARELEVNWEMAMHTWLLLGGVFVLYKYSQWVPEFLDDGGKPRGLKIFRNSDIWLNRQLLKCVPYFMMVLIAFWINIALRWFDKVF
ncbi:MAG: hypothetical protein AB7F75_06290 [Planctomycetota bacterium]